MKVSGYFNVRKIDKMLSSFFDNDGDHVVYIVPANLDKEIILEYIQPESFLGTYPKVMTFGDFYSRLSRFDENKPVVMDEPSQSIVLQHVIKNFIQEADRKGLELLPGVRHRGFKDIVRENLRALLAEDISVSDYMDKVFHDAEEIDLSRPEAILLKLYMEYMQYLDEHNLAEIGQVPALIRGLFDNEKIVGFLKKTHFVFVGFLTFTGSQLKTVRKLEEISESSFFLSATGLNNFHDSLKQLGLDFSPCDRGNLNILNIETADCFLQYHVVAKEIALWCSGEGVLYNKFGALSDLSDIGIMVSENSVTALSQNLERFNVPYSLRARATISDSLLGRVVREIWSNFVANWNYDKTLALLLSPLFGLTESEIGNISKRPDSEELWNSCLAERPRIVFRKLINLCYLLAKGGTPRELLMIVYNFFTDADLDIVSNIESKVGDIYEFDTAIKNVTYALEELSDKLADSEDVADVIGVASCHVLCGSDAVSYISEVFSSSKLPMPLSKSSAVQIYASLPSTLVSHKYFIMTDVDHRTWPGSIKESPLLREDVLSALNDSGRDKTEVKDVNNDNENNIDATSQNNGLDEEDDVSIFHVPAMNERREQKEALFRRLLFTAENGVVLVHSVTDSSGRPMPESPFVLHLESCTNSSGHENDFFKVNFMTEKPILYGKATYLPSDGEFLFDGIEYSAIPSRVSTGKNKLNFASDSDNIKLTVALSGLDDFVICPFLYWCHSREKIWIDFGTIYDNRKAGNLLHKIMENSYKDKLELNTTIRQGVEKYYISCAESEYPELITDQRLVRRKDFFRSKLNKLACKLDDCEINVSERTDIKTEYELKDYEIDGVKFSGIADRIDIFNDGFVIFDYKHNKAESHMSEWQLAAYCHILSETENRNPLGFVWVGLKDTALCGTVDSDVKKRYDGIKSFSINRRAVPLEIRLAEVAEHMTKMADYVKRGYYPASCKDEEICKHCKYRLICRRDEARFD